MNNELLRQKLMSLTYNETADAVMLRYIVLQLLAQYVSVYKEMRGSGKSLELLQQYRKLEATHEIFKEKQRTGVIDDYDFSLTKKLAIEHTSNISYCQQMLQAA